MRKKMLVVLAVVAVIGLTACQSNTESEGEKGATPTSVVAQEATKEDANNEAATKTATTVSAEETKAESTAEPVVEPEELTWENSGLRVEIIEYDRFEYGNTMRIAIVTNTSENTYVIDNSQIMILPGETTYYPEEDGIELVFNNATHTNGIVTNIIPNSYKEHYNWTTAKLVVLEPQWETLN